MACGRQVPYNLTGRSTRKEQQKYGCRKKQVRDVLPPAKYLASDSCQHEERDEWCRDNVGQSDCGGQSHGTG